MGYCSKVITFELILVEPEMNKTKSNKINTNKINVEEIDPDHFTVFKLKPGWEKEMADVWTPDTVKKFKERQEILSSIPLQIRERTRADKSYREGWVHAAKWIHQAINVIFHPDYDNENNGSGNKV